MFICSEYELSVLRIFQIFELTISLVPYPIYVVLDYDAKFFV